MAHRNPVAYGYGIEFKSGSAGPANRLFDNLPDLVEMDMAGHYVAVTVGDAYEGLIYVLIT